MSNRRDPTVIPKNKLQGNKPYQQHQRGKYIKDLPQWLKK